MYPELFKLGPFTVYTYGVLLAASYLLGLRLAMWRAKKWGLDPSRVLDLGIYIIIAALVGAKLRWKIYAPLSKRVCLTRFHAGSPRTSPSLIPWSKK